SIEIPFVEGGARDAKHFDDVAPLGARHASAFSKPKKLSQDRVFRRLQYKVLAGSNLDRASPVEFALVERLVATHEEVNLRHRLEMEDVPRGAAERGVAQCFRINREVGAQLMFELRCLSWRHFHHKVDVVGRARLALK